MATVNYSWNLPTVGGSEDTWGGDLNANWTALDTLLGGTNATEFAILDGATVSTAELNLLDGVTWTLTDYNTLTATAAELNILDGATLTTAELNYVDGVTSPIQTQLDGKAPLASPSLTGAPTAPTAAAGTNTTQVATTAFVNTQIPLGMAGLSAGAIGGDAWCIVRTVGTRPTFGQTIAGSNLSPSGYLVITTTNINDIEGRDTQSTQAGTALTGTWRCLGDTTSGQTSRYHGTLFRRIS